MIQNLLNSYRRYKNFNGSYQFTDYIQGQSTLLIIVIGYKQYLWKPVLDRIKAFTPSNYDICLVVPGKRDEHLLDIAHSNKWSLLSTSANKLALAQNIAIKVHTKAKLIFKIDEDIIIGKNTFEKLIELREKVIKEQKCDIGFIAPLLNVNGFSYIKLLQNLELTENYKSQFNELKISCMAVQAWSSGQAAQFLWQSILPFDETANKLQQLDLTYDFCPHRFSIGFILFERKLWEDMNGFWVAEEGALGVEESRMCYYCIDQSKLMVISNTILSGHFSFGPQTDAMKKLLEQNPKMLDIAHV